MGASLPALPTGKNSSCTQQHCHPGEPQTGAQDLIAQCCGPHPGLEPWAVTFCIHGPICELPWASSCVCPPTPTQPRGVGTVGPPGHAMRPWLSWVRPEMDSPHPICGWGGLLGPCTGLWLAALLSWESAKIPACTQDLNPCPGARGGTSRPS